MSTPGDTERAGRTNIVETPLETIEESFVSISQRAVFLLDLFKQSLQDAVPVVCGI